MLLPLHNWSLKIMLPGKQTKIMNCSSTSFCRNENVNLVCRRSTWRMKYLRWARGYPLMLNLAEQFFFACDKVWLWLFCQYISFAIFALGSIFIHSHLFFFPLAADKGKTFWYMPARSCWWEPNVWISNGLISCQSWRLTSGDRTKTCLIRMECVFSLAECLDLSLCKLTQKCMIRTFLIQA